MSDPWAVKSVSPLKATPAPADDPWRVVEMTAPKGMPTVSASKRSLGERFSDNFEEGRRGSLSGAAADALAGLLPGPEGVHEKDQNRDEVLAYQLRSDADPWYKAPGGVPGKIAAGGSTLAGVLAGGLPSPEAWLGPGKTALTRILANAGINAAVDVPVQALQNEAGTHEGLDPWRVVGAAATGGVVQGGFEVAGPVSRAVGKGAKAVAERAGRVFDGFDGENTIASRGADDGWGVIETRPAAPAAPRSTPDAGWEVASRQPIDRAPADASPLAEAGARSVLGEIFPGVVVTSGFRSAEKNASVGGAKNSFHTRGSGQAVDFVKPKGATVETIRAELQRRGLPVVELIDEGDHIHWAWGDKAPGGEPLGDAAARDSLPAEIDDVRYAEPAEPAARPTADGERAQAPVRRAGEDLDAQGRAESDFAGLAHFDANHARLYDLGKKAERGDLDLNEAARLVDDMAPFMDWSEGLSRRERKDLRADGKIYPRRMIDVAREYVRQFDETPDDRPSFYDAELYAEAGKASQAAKAANAERTPAESPAPADDIPIPERPTPRETPAPAATAKPAPTAYRDPTERALDAMRAGKRIRTGEGPSLADALLAEGGLRDEGGELTAILGGAGEDRRWKMLRRVNTGKTLDAAALWAQERGYIGGNLDEGHPRATPQDLLNAIRDEVAGKKRYAAPDPEAEELAAHADDLDELLTYLDLDPARMSNAEIRAAIDAHFAAPDQARTGTLAMKGRRADPDQLELPGVDPADRNAEALAAEMRRREGRRGSEVMPEGGLFDEVRRKEQDLFGRKLGMFAGKGAKSADRIALARARILERERASAEQIRQDTGWSRGDDGEWRYEIADNNSMFRLAAQPGLFGTKEVGIKRLRQLRAQGGGVARLENVIDHPKLFEAYPKLRKLSVVVDDIRGLGQMEGDTLVVGARALDGDPDGLKGVILHEIQHAIQNQEGWAIGAMTNAEGLRAAGYGQALDAAPDRLRARGAKITTPERDVYRRSAGEIEARNTEQRRAMTDEERRDVSPDETRDVPEEDAIVVRFTPERGLKEYPNRAARQGPAAMRMETTKDPSLRHARKPKGIRRADGEAFTGKPISELARDLRVALGITHRQGRLQNKQALGEYSLDSGAVRTKSMHELDVLAHESAHALEFTKAPKELEKAMKRHAALLETFDYDPVEARRHEGFAEWFRWYVTNPDVARKMAPNFYEEFEDAMRVDLPDAFKAIQGVQRGYSNLLKAGSIDVAAASVAHTGRPGALKRAGRAVQERGVGGVLRDVMDRGYTWFLDDLNPISRAERQLLDLEATNSGRARRDLKTSESPYRLARLSREAYAAGRLDALEGVVPYHGTDPEGPSLADALEKAFGKKMVGKWDQKDIDAFDAYLISRRMVFEWERFDAGLLDRPPDKYPKSWHEAVIADAEAEHATWGEAAQLAYQWNGRLWEKEHAAGLIGDEAFEAGKLIRDYVPLNRDISDKKAAGRPNRPVKGSLQGAGGTKRFGGSTRDVISPLTSMMRRSYELNAVIKRNDIVGTLRSMVEKAGPGSVAIAEVLPRTQMEATKVDALEALEKAAKERGVSTRDVSTLVAAAGAALGGDGSTTTFKSVQLQPKPGEEIVFHWKDGVKTPIQIADPDLYQAIAGMDRQMANGLVDVFSAGTQMLRHGVTLSPEFMAANIVRDQLATWINTDVGFTPGVDFLRGAFLQLVGGKEAKRYQAAGGMRGGESTAALKRPFPKDDNQARNQLQGLNKAPLNRMRTLNPLQGLAALTDLSESGTRLAVFKRAFDKAKKTGLDDYDAMLEAAFTSRDYMDFGRRGSRMLSAVRIVTFLNAQLQGLDKAARVLTAGGNLHKVLAPLGKNAPKTPSEKRALAHAYTAWAKISALAVFGGALRLIYADDPEYEEISDQTRATHWVFKANGQWWRMPKPFELAEPSNLLERFVEWKILEDPTAPDRMLKDAMATMAPPYEIPALTVPYQIAKNRSYDGRPIVPDHLRGTVDPELQFNAYTSKFGKMVGAALKVPPAVVDHVITGFGGSLGKYALQGGDLAIETATGAPRTATGPEDAFLARRFTVDPTRGSTSQKQFWDLVSRTGGKLTAAEGSFRLLTREGDDAKAAAYLNKLEPDERAYVLAKVMSERGSAKIHPLVRAQVVVSSLSELRRSVRDATVTTMAGKPIELTPEQRKAADDALADLGMAEMRNALITSGQKGWGQKARLARSDGMEELRAVDPRLPRLVRDLQREQGVLPAGVASRLWQTQRDRMEAEVSPRNLARVMGAKRLKSGDRKSKREEAIRQVRGAVGE